MDRQKADYLYEPSRLVEISDALRSLQKKSKEYLEEYERSSIFFLKLFFIFK